MMLVALGFGLSACDEIAVMDDPDALLDLRGNKSCVRAVNATAGVSNARPNTTLPVVEVNQYIIDVPGSGSYFCYTDDNGSARQLVKMGA